MLAGVKDNYVYKEWDARGNAVTKTVNPETYTLARVTDPTGQAVNYTYDAAHCVTQVMLNCKYSQFFIPLGGLWRTTKFAILNMAFGENKKRFSGLQSG